MLKDAIMAKILLWKLKQQRYMMGFWGWT